MKLMEDKEVGELWRKRHQCQNEFYARKIGELIRKLVEERAHKIAVNYYKIHGPDDDAVKSCMTAALRDFGIDPEDWLA